MCSLHHQEALGVFHPHGRTSEGCSSCTGGTRPEGVGRRALGVYAAASASLCGCVRPAPEDFGSASLQHRGTLFVLPQGASEARCAYNRGALKVCFSCAAVPLTGGGEVGGRGG